MEKKLKLEFDPRFFAENKGGCRSWINLLLIISMVLIIFLIYKHYKVKSNGIQEEKQREK